MTSSLCGVLDRILLSIRHLYIYINIIIRKLYIIDSNNYYRNWRGNDKIKTGEHKVCGIIMLAIDERGI